MTVADVTVRVRDLHVSYEAVTDEGAGVKGLLSRRNRKFRRIHAVRGVSFDLYAGESLGIIGSNGSGKSTLLAALTGLLPVESGEVLVRSRPTLLGVGAVMRPSLSGRRNIAIGGLAIGLSLDEVNEQMDSIIDFAGLRESIDLPMRTYSSGMRARLMFAIATSSIPEILLIDEALAVGDAEFAQRSQRRIDTIRARAGSVVLVSHNHGEIRSSCDRVMWLEKGELVAEGDPDEVIDAYEERVRGRLEEKLVVLDTPAAGAATKPVRRVPVRPAGATDRTLTVHIGSNFTSAPVQRYLVDHEHDLASAGVSVPSYLGLRSHYPFAAAAFERAAELLPVDVGGDWKHWRDEFVAGAIAHMDNGNDWVISSELIGAQVGPKGVVALRELANELGFERARVVLFIQRQDRLAARSHIADVLAGSPARFDLDAECGRVARHDWQRLYRWWGQPDTFDEVVIRHHPRSDDPLEIIAAFADAAQIPFVGAEGAVGLPALSDAAVDFLQQLPHPDATEGANRATIMRAARVIATTAATPFSLTASESAQLQETFAEPNAWILDKVEASHREADYFDPDPSLPAARSVADRDELVRFAGRIARSVIG